MKLFIITLLFSISLFGQNRVSEIITYSKKTDGSVDKLQDKQTFEYSNGKLVKIIKLNPYTDFSWNWYSFSYENNMIIGVDNNGKVNFEFEMENSKPIYIMNSVFSTNLTFSYNEDGSIASIISIPEGGKRPYKELWSYTYSDGILSHYNYGNVMNIKKPKAKDLTTSNKPYVYKNGKIVKLKFAPREISFEYADNEKTVIDGSKKTVYKYVDGKIKELQFYSKQEGEDFKLHSRKIYIYESGQGNEGFFLDYLNYRLFLRTLQPTDGML